MHSRADSRLRSPAFWALGLVLFTVVLRLPALVHQAPIDDEAVYAVVADTIVRRRPSLRRCHRAQAAAALLALRCGLRRRRRIQLARAPRGRRRLGPADDGRPLRDCAASVRLARGSDRGAVVQRVPAVGTWKNLAFNGELLMNLPLVWGWAIALAPGRSRYRFALVPGRHAPVRRLPAEAAGGDRGRAARRLPAVAGVPTVARAHGAGIGAARRAAHARLLRRARRRRGRPAAAGHSRRSVLLDVHQSRRPARLLAARPRDDRGVRRALPAARRRGAGGPRGVGGRRAERRAIAGWLAVSAIGAAAGARFYPHYYIQLLPPLALLASPPFARLWREGAAYRRLPRAARDLDVARGDGVVFWPPAGTGSGRSACRRRRATCGSTPARAIASSSGDSRRRCISTPAGRRRRATSRRSR